MEAGMIVTNQDEYRRAFVEYLRKGTPIRLQTKQATTSGQYVGVVAKLCCLRIHIANPCG
jgi:hypothetical protein